MQKRKFTVVTQLHEKHNADLIEYVNANLMSYAQAMRKTFYDVKHTDSFNKSTHHTYLQNKYSITRRKAGSIISDAQGRYNALKELKVYEKETTRAKDCAFREHRYPQT